MVGLWGEPLCKINAQSWGGGVESKIKGGGVMSGEKCKKHPDVHLDIILIVNLECTLY